MLRQSHGSNVAALRDTVALILAGGAGTRLKSLTQWHAKPAVNFAGKYRTIDFPLSNCLYSNIRRISILTQYKSHSLNTHIQQGWNFLRPELNEYVELLPAQQRIKGDWYSGTADAVFQNLDILAAQNPRYVLVLAGDHVYKMDYNDLLQHHIRQDADMTIACLEVPLADAKEFGVMEVDASARVVGFEEKPRQPKPLPGRSDQALASMGIYIFSWAFLQKVLWLDADSQYSQHDFGKDIIPQWINKAQISAYRFRDGHSGQPGYWRDVGTIDAYFEAHMDLLQPAPDLDLYDPHWPIWTYQSQLPPTRFLLDDDNRRGSAVDSLISEGCVISGAKIKRSVLSPNVKVHSYAQVEDSVILPDVDIGRHCRLRKVVIDRGCKIPPGTTIGFDNSQDGRLYHVSTKGVTLVSPDRLGQPLYNVA